MATRIARNTTRYPRLAVVHFEVDQTTMTLATSELRKLPMNEELVIENPVHCKKDGVVHQATLIFMTDDREEANYFEKRFWKKNNLKKAAKVCTSTYIVNIVYVYIC